MEKPLFILLFIIGIQAIAQEKVCFNMHYKPETQYIGETNMTMKVTTKHSGSDSYMSYFRETGMDTISKAEETTNVKMELKVLSKDERGVSPVEMKYIYLETNGLENSFATGMIALGTIEGSNLPVLKSLRNSSFDSNLEKEFISGVNLMFEQIKFPNVELAVEESFEDTMPFVMLIGNLEMNMEINSIYLLKEIIGNRALLEIIQFGEISFKEEGKNYSGEYKGTGHFYYDLIFDFIEESKLEYSFEINYFSKYNNIQILVDADIFQKFEIVKL